MLNKLHILVGLKDNVSDLEASNAEKVGVYTMYTVVALILLLAVNIG